jgi:hypothetical protein
LIRCAAMVRFLWMLLLAALPAFAAERKFDFSVVREHELPPGFRSAVTGQGRPGDWRVLLDDVAPLLEPLTPNAPSVAKRAVLAQLAEDPTDEHFPLLILEEETFGDFTFTTQFKTVRGRKEQMAGIAFRIQNETNYYLVRASSLGNTFKFYKVVNGQRGELIGPQTPIPSGVWHQLSISCKGNEIRLLLNGKELIPPLTDHSFTSGKIGFWTKSDSVSYFADAKIVYTPRELPAQVIVREMMEKYPRLLGLKIFVAGQAPEQTRLIGSKDEKELGEPGGETEHAGDRPGRRVLWEREAISGRDDAVARSQWRSGRGFARHHEIVSRPDGTECRRSCHAHRQRDGTSHRRDRKFNQLKAVFLPGFFLSILGADR